MAVKIRLMRMGKKKQPVYRVVVSDGRKPRDGRYIEAIGRYDARQDPSLVEIDNERAIDWIEKGAQPTEPVRKLLEISGAVSKMKVSRGEIHTVGAATTAEPAPAATVEQTAPAEPEQVEAAAVEEPVAPAEVEPVAVEEPAEVPAEAPAEEETTDDEG